MKQLLLMRHAKSSWDQVGQPDFERTLNERGKKDAPEMGKRIKHHGFMPDLMVVSPAKRTTKTAKAVAEVLQYPEHDIVFDSTIYEAHIDDVMRIIRGLPVDTKKVILIGHNPTFTGLVGYLTNSFIENMPTAGIALIEFKTPDWHLITQHSGSLTWFDYPKS